MTRHLFARLGAALLLAAATCAGAADTATDAIRHVLMAQFDKPEARLVVEPVALAGDSAVAGWTQGERGGRALLTRTGGRWQIVLCAGDALKDARVMQEAGVPAHDAQAIARSLVAAEARLSAAQRARFASFDGIVRMAAGGHHPPAQEASAGAAQITVQDPWVRGTVAQQKATGLFARITSGAGGRLVAASSPVAKVVEIHEMAMEGDVMKMRAVAAVDLPAGKAVELKPGGYHVMLMELNRQLGPGDTVPVTLVVEGRDGKRENVEVKAPVRALGAGHDGLKH